MCCAAARGTTIKSTRARPTAMRIIRAIGTTRTVVGWWRVRPTCLSPFEGSGGDAAVPTGASGPVRHRLGQASGIARRSRSAGRGEDPEMARERPVRTGAGGSSVGRIQDRGGLLGVQLDPEAASLSPGGRGALVPVSGGGARRIESRARGPTRASDAPGASISSGCHRPRRLSPRRAPKLTTASESAGTTTPWRIHRRPDALRGR